MERRLQNSRIRVALLIAPDGLRHIILPAEMVAYCGAVEGTRHAPQWIDRRYVCQRCLQKYTRIAEGRDLE